MTLVSTPTRLTAEDLLGLPDNANMEFVNGQILEKTVSLLSSNVGSWINGIFVQCVMKGAAAKVFGSDMGYQCFQMLVEEPDRMRKPDVSVVRLERIRKLSDPNPGYMPIYPDLAVEVVSTNDLLHEIVEKVREYRSAGFPLVWVVEPIEKTVTVYSNPGKPVILTVEDTIDASNALPGFSCKVADLFPPE